MRVLIICGNQGYENTYDTIDTNCPWKRLKEIEDKYVQPIRHMSTNGKHMVEALKKAGYKARFIKAHGNKDPMTLTLRFEGYVGNY